MYFETFLLTFDKLKQVSNDTYGCSQSGQNQLTIQEKKDGFLRVFHVTKARCVVRKMGGQNRVSVQGVKSLGGHFACLCRGFDFYEVKKNRYYFSKRKGKYFYTFNHFYSEQNSTNLLL